MDVLALEFYFTKKERNKYELVVRKGRKSLGTKNGDIIVGIMIFFS
jgi:hypothetical protein